MLYSHMLRNTRLPAGKEWKQLLIFGALNTTLYLGLFAYALQQTTPGITTLALALNPLFIGILSALGGKRRVTGNEWLGILVGITGVAVASMPLLQLQYATLSGMILLAISMFAYSWGAVYYASIPWTLSRTTINAWQVFIGGLLLIPFTLFFYGENNHYDTRFWASLLWLVFPVSILAVQLWLQLLKADAVKASLWLYLCPVFGFLYANLLLDEPITLYTLAGTILVAGALYLGNRKQK